MWLLSKTEKPIFAANSLLIGCRAHLSRHSLFEDGKITDKFRK